MHSKSHDKKSEFERINQAIKSYDRREISRIYGEYAPPFVAYIKKRYAFLQEDDIYSIYNESLAFVFEWSRQGKLMYYGAGFKTFLLNVGIKRTLTYLKKHFDNHQTESMDSTFSLPSAIEKERNVHPMDARFIRNIVKGMKAPCDVILSLTFADVSLNDIATLLERTVDATKTKRSQCMKLIRQTLEKLKIGKEDLYGES